MQSDPYFLRVGTRDGRHCIGERDWSRAQIIIAEVIQNIVPPDRSAAFGPGYRERIENRLKAANIDFKKIDFMGAEYLVWDEKDAELVGRIVREELQKGKKIGVRL